MNSANNLTETEAAYLLSGGQTVRGVWCSPRLRHLRESAAVVPAVHIANARYLAAVRHLLALGLPLCRLDLAAVQP